MDGASENKLLEVLSEQADCVSDVQMLDDEHAKILCDPEKIDQLKDALNGKQNQNHVFQVLESDVLQHCSSYVKLDEEGENLFQAFQGGLYTGAILILKIGGISLPSFFLSFFFFVFSSFSFLKRNFMI